MNKMFPCLEAALAYHDAGYPVIPVGQDKRPLIPSWKEFQKVGPDREQVKRWFSRYPEANIGIITGKQAGLLVVDVDSEEGYEELSQFLPDTLVTPIAKTPHGHHFCFEYQDGFTNRVRILRDIDIRTEGGYIVAPPSRTKDGEYAWQDGLELLKTPLAPMPETLERALKGETPACSLKKINTYKGLDEDRLSKVIPPGKNPSTLQYPPFSQGQRDNTLFSIADAMAKNRIPKQVIENTLEILAINCDPPFPQNEVTIKVQSALKRLSENKKALSQEVREFVLSSNGIFTSSEIHSGLQLSSRQEKKNTSLALGRLVDEGLIERVGKRNGHFRLVDKDLQEMDFFKR